MVFLGLLGGDDDHAVGGQCTVYARCGSIFEHSDALNVVEVDVAEG